MSVPEGAGEVGREIQVKATWPDDMRDSARVVNQFAVTNEIPTMHGMFDGGVYLTLGHLSQPLVQDPVVLSRLSESGEPLELPVRTLGTYYLSVERARDLMRVLETHLNKLPGGSEQT